MRSIVTDLARRRWPIVLGLVFVWFLAGLRTHTTAAETSSPSADDLFRSLWSPYCKGVSLLECPSSQAENLREEIRSRLSEGQSADDLITDLKARYGDQLRMSPEPTGREGLAYWLPWILFVTTATIVVLIFFGRRKRQVRQGPKEIESQAYHAQIEADLDPR